MTPKIIYCIIALAIIIAGFVLYKSADPEPGPWDDDYIA
jgi:hypothetical protein